MAEGIHAIAVDVRHGAGAAELKIAGDECDADRIARLERSFERHLARTRARRAAAARNESLIPKCAADHIRDLGLEARHRQRRRDGVEQRAELRAAETGNRTRAREPRVAGAIRERPIPIQRFAKRGGQALACQRKFHLHARGARTRAVEGRGVRHLRNRRNAGDRLFREAAQRIRDGADQFAVDVDGTAAHPGDDAGVRERSAFEFGEYEVAMRPDDVLEHADDVDLEFLDPSPIEDRSADADHSGPDLIDAHLVPRSEEQRRHGGNCREQDKYCPADLHGFDPLYGRSRYWSRRNGRSC